MKKFNKRIGNYEIRSCNNHLLLDGPHTKIDIIKWYKYDKKESCFSIGIIEQNLDSNWDLIFMLDRYAKSNKKVINSLIKYVLEVEKI